MHNYFELGEDLYIKDRWFIDGPVDDDQRDEREFRRGNAVELRGILEAPIHTSGTPLDFTLTIGHIPILSKRLSDAIRPLIAGQAQLFPVKIHGHPGFEVLNVTMLLCCVDEIRSDIIRFGHHDGRPDKLGQYLMIRKLFVAPKNIPDGIHVFRIKQWELPLIVSQAFVDTILPLNPTGVKLKLVT